MLDDDLEIHDTVSFDPCVDSMFELLWRAININLECGIRTDIMSRREL